MTKIKDSETKRKPQPRKQAKPKAEPKPAHPLMLDGKDWNRDLVMSHLCDELATSSRGIGSILKNGYNGLPLPTYSTIMLWLDEDRSLSERYEKAKAAQADFMADELLEIADDGRNDWMEKLGKDGQPVGFIVNGEHVQRSRLRVDTRKWLAAKLRPKKYGEKVDLNHGGQPENPVQVATKVVVVPQKSAAVVEKRPIEKE